MVPVSLNSQPRSRRALTAAAPGAIAWLGAVLAAWFGWTWAAVALTLVAAAITPVAQRLSHRMVLWTTAALAIGSLWSVIPDQSATVRSGIVAAAVLAPIAAFTLVRSRRSPAWLPELDKADALILAGALALFLLLIAPYLGGSPDDVLLDLARGYDNWPHFTMLRNLAHEGSALWPTDDGAPPVGQTYPLSVHYLMAFALTSSVAAEAEIPAGLLRDFGVLAAASISMASALIGWMSAEVAALVPNSMQERGKRLLAGTAFLVAAPAGGLFTGLFEVGHVPFALPTATIVVASWLATSLPPGREIRGVVLLCLAGLGAVGSYPTLLLGLVPAMLFLVFSAGERIQWSVVLVMVGAMIGAAILLWERLAGVSALAVSQGQISTEPLVAVTGVVLMGLLLVMAHNRGTSRQVVLGAGPVLGLGMAVLALALLSANAGTRVLDNYYLGKMLQAQWIAAGPLVVGLASGLIVNAVSARPASREMRPGRFAVIGLMLGLLLSYVPDGRYVIGPRSPAPAGIQLLERRLLEASRSGGAASVVATAQALGPAHGGLAILANPAGWGGYVSFDDPAWTKAPSVASEWLASLRGVTSTRQRHYAECADLPAAPALECLRNLQQQSPAHMVDIVVPPEEIRLWSDLVGNKDVGIRVVARP